MRRRDVIAVLLSAGLLAGAAAERISVLPPWDAATYHERVLAASQGAPARIGDWDGKDCPMPVEASKMLRPNVVISRAFTNSKTGKRVSFALIQCKDVRDMLCHYPPICYPLRGLTEIGRRGWDRSVQGLGVHGTEYQFESSTFQTPDLTIVENFMVLPDGRIVRDMQEVRQQLKLRSRYFGAAQVQVVFDSQFTAAERMAICDQFIAAHKELIDAVRSGVRP